MLNSASVSKDGRNEWTRGHPSRRGEDAAPQDDVGDFFTASIAGDPVFQETLMIERRRRRARGIFIER
jgi:hypothetical protein